MPNTTELQIAWEIVQLTRGSGGHPALGGKDPKEIASEVIETALFLEEGVPLDEDEEE